MNTAMQKKILVDLHCCFNNYGGIPHDTRVLFTLLRKLPEYAVWGHVFPTNLNAINFTQNNAQSDICNQSSFIAHIEDKKKKGRKYRLQLLIKIIFSLFYLSYKNNTLFTINGKFFEDYIWRRLFSSTLSVSAMEDIVSSPYVASGLSHGLSQFYFKTTNRATCLDTKDFDVYIAQPPFALQLPANTKLIIRWHDAIPLTFPHTVNNMSAHQKAYAKMLEKYSSTAYFVCNSEYTREKLIEIVPNVQERSFVAYCCVPQSFKQSITKNIYTIINQYCHFSNANNTFFDKPYFLAVGTLEPRKNFITLTKAFIKYIQEYNPDENLVIVANKGWGVEHYKEIFKILSKSSRIYWLENVPDYDLVKLYSHAKATIVPSFEEGFSYSGVESMRCKTPVLASNIAVHKEIYGSHATYFNPYSIDNIIESFKNPFQSTQDGKELYDFSLKYSEDNVLQQWKHAIQNILQ